MFILPINIISMLLIQILLNTMFNNIVTLTQILCIKLVCFLSKIDKRSTNLPPFADLLFQKIIFSILFLYKRSIL